MPLDFPDAPVADEVYTDTTSGASYAWNGTAWDKAGSGSGGSTPPAGDFLPLTGGTLTGPLTVNAAEALHVGMIGSTSSDYGYLKLEAADGSELYGMMWSGIDFKFTKGSTGLFLWSNVFTTNVVNFIERPTVNGTPVVMKTDHDAAITKLEKRIALLEARLAKAKL